MKPILACDVDWNKLKFPVVGLPKIDGVRALCQDEKLVARSGKPFKNILNTKFFSHGACNGFDGEMVTDRITGGNLCSETTSALATIKGAVPTNWCIFDLVTQETMGLGYLDRYEYASQKLQWFQRYYPNHANRLWMVPLTILNSKGEVLAYERRMLDDGFEGIILRGPDTPYKNGRATTTEGYYLRVKRFKDAEIVVTRITEGVNNHNTPTKTPHGHTERPSIQENLIPSGKLGTIIGTLQTDVMFNGVLLLPAGTEVTVSPGKMSHDEREYYFNNQQEIIGKLVKFQHFPVGVKDKLRFPTFQSFRDTVDT